MGWSALRAASRGHDLGLARMVVSLVSQGIAGAINIL
jgi:hypothetical protein